MIRNHGAAVAVVMAAAAFSWPAGATERGLASTYTDTEVSCRGEHYRANALAAAHRTLPCGTMVKVTNLANGKAVVVKITDRGPCGTPGCRKSRPDLAARIIDLTPAADRRIASAGMAMVELEPVQLFEDRWGMVTGAFPKAEGHPDAAEPDKRALPPTKPTGAGSLTKAQPEYRRNKRYRKKDRQHRAPKSTARG